MNPILSDGGVPYKTGTYWHVSLKQRSSSIPFHNSKSEFISKTDKHNSIDALPLQQYSKKQKVSVWKLFMNVRKVKLWSTTWNWLLCLPMNVQNGWRHCSNGIKHWNLYIPIYERAEKRGKIVFAMPRRNYQSQRHLWMYWIIPSLLLNL